MPASGVKSAILARKQILFNYSVSASEQWLSL